MDNFDLRKYLVENKVTINSRMMSENEEDEGPQYDYNYKEGPGASEKEINELINHFKSNPVIWKMAAKKDFEQMAKGGNADIKTDQYPEWKKEDFKKVLAALESLGENKVTTNSRMMNEEEDAFSFLDAYITPINEPNPQLASKVKAILDSYELSDLEQGIDTFGEALLDYYTDLDQHWPGMPDGMANDLWDAKLRATVKAYKAGTIDLKKAISQFRKVLSNPRHYQGAGNRDTTNSKMLNENYLEVQTDDDYNYTVLSAKALGDKTKVTLVKQDLYGKPDVHKMVDMPFEEFKSKLQAQAGVETYPGDNKTFFDANTSKLESFLTNLGFRL